MVEKSREEGYEVFDGLMLGDAGLVCSGGLAYFKLELSAGNPDKWHDTSWSRRDTRIPQLQYLWYIRDYLELLGIEFCEGHPRAYRCLSSTGRPYLKCLMESTISSFLLTQHERWYRLITNEVRRTRYFRSSQKWYKVLPDDIKLTSSVIARWFEGDGNTAWKPYPHVQLTIATNSFTKEEVEKLSKLFSLLNVRMGVYQHLTGKQTTWQLGISTIEGSNAFFNLFEECIHPCYKYKVKRAKHVSECNTGERCSRLKRNEYQRELYRKKKKEQAILSDPELSSSLARIQSVKSAIGR